MMNNYVIVSFLQEVFPENFHENEWPLHMTVVRNFASSDSVNNLLNILNDFSAKQQQLIVYGKSREMFGVDKNVSVTELEHTEELRDLHSKLHEMLIDVSKPIGPQYDSYRPHVTDHGTTSIGVGEEVLIQSISLVELIGKERCVLKTFRFN